MGTCIIAENPADLLSRRQSANELLESNLWHRGPAWLINHEETWPTALPGLSEIPEQRASVNLNVITSNFDILNKYSSITKLTRVLAYCRRFTHNASSQNKLRGILSTNELTESRTLIIKLTQHQPFAREIRTLQKGKHIDGNSKLLSLSRFLDSNGLLRVGGRIKHASIMHDNKHPALLPKDHHITHLIVKNEHTRNWHAGVQATLYMIRQKYWIISGRITVRRIIYQYLRCHRENDDFTSDINS